jgi:hypothetical protein
MKRGLVPQIGDRSRAAGEDREAVYAFHDLVSVRDALMNWLGDSFDEDVELSIIEFKYEGNSFIPGAAYECLIGEIISPSSFICIRDENSELIRDFVKKPICKSSDVNYSIGV